jgi:hypothetical protein
MFTHPAASRSGAGRPPGGASGGSDVIAARTRSVWVRYAVVAVIVEFVVFSLVGRLNGVVSGTTGRIILPPLLTWVSSAATVMTFLFAVPAVISVFTYNSDLRLLLLTPLSPRLLMTEKLLNVYLQRAPLLVLVGAPILLGVGSALSLGPVFSIVAIVVLLVLPLAPIALAQLVLAAVLRWLPPRWARTATVILTTALAIGLYTGSQLLLRGGGGHQAANLRSLFAQSTTAWWQSWPTTWPGSALAATAKGDAGSAASYLAGTAVLGLALAGIAVLVTAYLFATGWATYQEVGARRRTAQAGARTVEPQGRPGTAGFLPAPVEHGSQPGGAAASPALVDGPATAVARQHTGTGAPAGGSPTVSGGAGVLPASAGNAGQVAATIAPAAARRAAPAVHDAPTLGQVWRPLWRKEWWSLKRDAQVWARMAYPLVIVLFGLYRSFNPTGASHTASIITLFSTLGTCLFFFGIGFLPLRVVNREGHSLYLLALAPLAPRHIFLVKWAFCVVPGLVVAEAIVAAGIVSLQLTVWQALLCVVALGFLVIAMNGVLILIGIIWPRFDWDGPNRQVSVQATFAGIVSCLALVGGGLTLLVFTLTDGPGSALWAVAGTAGIFLVTVVAAVVALVFGAQHMRRLLEGAY